VGREGASTDTMVLEWVIQLAVLLAALALIVRRVTSEG
jgi:uncharacterized membrane protein YhaH (DUF805 family)